MLTCTCCSITLRQLIHRDDRTLLSRIIHPLLNCRSPLLQLLPIHKDDITIHPTTDELNPALLVHKQRNVSDIALGESPVDGGVAEEGEVEIQEVEAEDAVVPAVGEDERGPFGELGVVGCCVELAGEEGGKVVLGRERERGR